ncbi:hypothetical protein BJX66DRAFT_342728 [Aspergillus keveii]|uniref:Uncharacterized protein n=1 Tax=Aspergillus keveii TaxID=714993 RepID=A0ABR4FRH5_9EURO
MAIAQKAAQCALSLEGILQAAPTEDARQEWENQIFRFNLWSANNFVFAPIRASMDWRLRNAPLLESSMCELLEDLQSALIRHAAIMKTANHQGETDRDNSVSDTLEDLFRLSRAIRRSGILRRFVKIESYIEFDENGVNLTDEFRKGVERLLVFRLKDSPASQILRERVVNTICLRQQHFASLRAKWENGTVQPAANSPAPVQPRSSLGATFSVRGSIASSPSPDKKKERVSIPTIMTATTAQPERVKLARSIKSAVSVEHEEFECNEEDLPLPPKVPPDAAEYECPFCYMVCSSSEFWGERWKKHIVPDIMPYFCVFDDCPTTNTLFESGRDWLRHMRERHVVTGWTCMDQSHGTTLIFDTQSRFKDHMYTCHTGEFADDELDDITAASHQRLAPHNLVTTCLFCPIDITASIPTDRMMDHVAKHMLSLARVSVSWQMEGESSDSQSSQQYLVVRNPGGHVPIPRSRSRRPLDMEMMNSEGYTVHRGGSFGKRLQEDFPSVDDENYDTDEEYAPDDGSLPEGDWEFFDTLWRDVRQDLQLPPLGMETGNEASIPEVQQHVQRRDTGHEDPMEAELYSASDQSVASSIISASYKPPGTQDSEYPQNDRYQEYHYERRVREASPPRGRVLRR